eukprot:PLAT1222.1.p1 GENE.PLAT1222.1~~PLAT1222.1.p1  ORF type:complete len:293 (+),score=99.89 PLAT1222.1:30-881(+)
MSRRPPPLAPHLVPPEGGAAAQVIFCLFSLSRIALLVAAAMKAAHYPVNHTAEAGFLLIASVLVRWVEGGLELRLGRASLYSERVRGVCTLLVDGLGMFVLFLTPFKNGADVWLPMPDINPWTPIPLRWKWWAFAAAALHSWLLALQATGALLAHNKEPRLLWRCYAGLPAHQSTLLVASITSAVVVDDWLGDIRPAVIACFVCSVLTLFAPQRYPHAGHLIVGSMWKKAVFLLVTACVYVGLRTDVISIHRAALLPVAVALVQASHPLLWLLPAADDGKKAD